ncbi:hypothetical protein Bbelb_057850 [Branchiostoma belcheri]|nr:hypothetical protein Bbelb_057850 [Branchiostoma belcheri]
MLAGGTAKVPSTLYVEKLSVTPLQQGTHGEASDKAPNVTMFTPLNTSIVSLKRPHQRQHLTLVVLSPVAAISALAVIAILGFKNARQRRKRRTKRTRARCARARFRYQESHMYSFDNYTMQGIAHITVAASDRSGMELKKTPVHAIPFSCFNMASGLSSATRCGVVAGAANPVNALPTTQKTYMYIDTNEEVTRGNRTVDNTQFMSLSADSLAYGLTDRGVVAGAANTVTTLSTTQKTYYIDTNEETTRHVGTRTLNNTEPMSLSADSSAYGHTEQARPRTGGSLCRSSVGGTASAIYTASDDAVNFVYDEIKGEKESEQNQSVMYYPMEDVRCQGGTDESDYTELP